MGVFLDLLVKVLLGLAAAGVFVWAFDRATAWIVQKEQEEALP